VNIRYSVVGVTALFFFAGFQSRKYFPLRWNSKGSKLRDEWAAWREGSVFFGSTVAASAWQSQR